MQPPKSKAFEHMAKLMKQHPNESEDQLLRRWLKLCAIDGNVKEAVYHDVAMGEENLEEAVFRAADGMMEDELYDEAARTGRSIPPGLRRPS